SSTTTLSGGVYMRLPTVNVAAAVVAVINVSAAVAQEASQITVEEVLVTASKRGEQVLQEVAGNIQVISSQTLEQLNVDGLDDYVKLVPGLDMISSGAGQSQVVLRGVTAGREDEHPREATS